MGQASRPRPARLAEKLLYIRTALKLSQNELIAHLGLAENLSQHRISEFESGAREPALAVLLAYARAANVWIDALVDDDLDLPKQLPSREKSGGIKRHR